MSTSRAVVIGAGLGGLAAALRLRVRGYDVTLLESTEQLGGRAAVWHKDGFTFDAGPTVVTAPYLFDELFEMCGRDPKDYYELLPVDPYYRVKFDDGAQFDYVGEESRILAEIERLSPQDVDGYRRLAAQSKRIFDVGYTRLADVSFHSPKQMLKAVPAMMRLQSYRSLYGLVSRYIKDPRLRQVFSFQSLLIGGNPFDCPSIYLLIHWLERKWGVHYAKGGTGALVHAMGELLGELGVDIHLDAPVDHIDVDAGKTRAVLTEDGRRFQADIVVSNADPGMVYSRMIEAQHRPKNSDRRIAKRRQSMSLFVAYFGAEGSWEDTAHHTILLGPRYKGLLSDIFHRKHLAEDFSLYLHRPSATDGSVNPPGQDGFYVLSPVPNQKSGLDWETVGEEYGKRILDHLDRTELPGLKDRLTTWHQVDPRYFEGRLRSTDGSAFGIEPVLRQSAYFRYHNRCGDIDGLYFVGANTHPGAGMPGVLCSAKVADSLIPAPQNPLPMPTGKPMAKAVG